MRRRSFLALAASLALLPHRTPVLAEQTPVADEPAGPMDLLRLLPDAPVPEGGILLADYDALLAARGIAGGGSDLAPDAWFPALGQRAMGPRVGLDPSLPDWREGLGFDLRDVAAMVDVGPSDIYTLLVTGRFDAAVLTAAWEAGGYTATETDGVTWYTLGADNVIFDPAFPLSSWHIGMLSHLALLDDGTVVGTSRRAEMERVLALHAGEAASFAAGLGAVLVAAAPADFASGWIVDGMRAIPIGDPLAGMANNPNLPADAQARMATQAAITAEEAPRMPPLALVLVGTTAGAAGAAADEPKPHAIAIAVPVDPADADTVAETVTRRLETQVVPLGDGVMDRPYREVFTAMSVEPTPDGAVVIDLTPAPDVDPRLVVTLQESGQLTLLHWGG